MCDNSIPFNQLELYKYKDIIEEYNPSSMVRVFRLIGKPAIGACLCENNVCGFLARHVHGSSDEERGNFLPAA